jgi:hypothetical protein
MTAREALLSDIDAFLARHGMPDSRFGRDAVNDSHLLRRMRAGGDVTLGTADRLRAFMASHETPPPAQVAA